MCNAITKYLSVGLIVVSLSSCGSQKGRHENEASDLLDQARELAENKNYDSALSIISSIDSLYPEAIATRREAMGMRSEYTIESLKIAQAELEAYLADNASYGDSLRARVKFVENPVEGFFMAVDATDTDVRSIPGFHARVSPQFTFYAVATSPSSVDATSVAVSTSGRTANTSTVASDGERNEKVGNRDVITFTEAEADTIASLLFEHRTSEATLTFNGTKQVSMQLPKNQVESAATLYEWVKAIRADKQKRIELEKVKKELEIATRQAAQTSQAEP